MKPSESLFVPVRGLRYHCRAWGKESAPKLFMLHGWMDVSASFQFLVDALTGGWRVIAPDWRGFGLTGWTQGGSYWFPDYFADLERLLEHFQPGTPAMLVGHSMGGNVAAMYAGIRPERVAKLVDLEGLGLADAGPEKAPGRYARWLADLAEDKPGFRDYENFDALAGRLRSNNPRLSVERSLFLARHWGRAKPDGRVELASDPAHKLVNPVLYRAEEAMACWRKVTAPVLWVEGAESNAHEFLKLSAAELAARKQCFQKLTERVIPDAGHMLHHDQPERVAAVVEEFLR
ncbi:MAG TPA: alpha/beta hydrolase [Burkholderiales bacterium]|nr:alpha/beta hydrolase [Burkholderiales bacterium]